MSDTPRTDAASWFCNDGRDEFVDADFARELERENARLREAIEPFVPPHAGRCIDFSQPGWPVTEESCRCSPEAKRLRRAIEACLQPSGWTAPSAIPPDVARKIIAARDALIRDDTSKAWHHLYSIADPEFVNFEPWAILEAQCNKSDMPTPAE